MRAGLLILLFVVGGEAEEVGEEEVEDLVGEVVLVDVLENTLLYGQKM